MTPTSNTPSVPYYQDESVTIYCADFKDVLPALGEVDLIVTDPPYGIGWHPRVNHTDGPWKDNVRPDPADFKVGRHNCIWGGNYFANELPAVESWIIWVKRPGDFDFDDDPRTYALCEMAWTDFGGKPRTKHHVWDGGKRAGDASNREFSHPAQKPLELMRWCISLAPGEPQLVVDPFMGSGTTLRAAKDLGLRAIGIEIEQEYCDVAVRRMGQGSLFEAVA